MASPHANRQGRFAGVTLAFLGLQIPEGKDVPFRPGLAFAPSQGRLPSGAAFNQRLIQACGGDLEFARPLTAAPPGCPLPLMQFMACLVPSSSSRVLGMLANAVEATRRMAGTAVGEGEPAKRQKRTWRKLQALIGAVGRRQGCDPIRSATAILPAHWANPGEPLWAAWRTQGPRHTPG